MAMSKQWTRVRTLGRGASGAEVFLAADDPSGELFAVKSASAACAAALRREQCIISRDVKARNIVIGADGRAKLADFGCARDAGADVPIIGGTPAFMAPEVARGEEQGPAADVWALGCMVVEMATGRAPWSGMDGNALAALHRIGYTEAAPEASERCTAAQLLDHPFLASAGIVDAKPQAVESKSKWVSPKSTLDAALWESESDTEEAAEHESTAERRMRALACPASALPDWDSDEGWIDVLSGPSEAVPVAAEETAELDDAITPCGEESGVLDAILVQGAYQDKLPRTPWRSMNTKRSSLVDHPFLASADVEAKPEAVESKSKWVSPKSTLDAAFWESESDTDEAEHDSAAEMRIRALACPASALPDWECDDGWIDVLAAPIEAPDAVTEERIDLDDDAVTTEEPRAAVSGVLGIIVDVECIDDGGAVVGAGAGDAYDDDSLGHNCFARWRCIQQRPPSSDGVPSPL
ncbi:Mitogen-activated protein kinase kinase kinase A [Triticum urartu]|uniref:Mitogen-activated protein kinase kinase kinase A n=1 Tax=Triticum urartu TaxID=4572 RepID=M8AKB8_TRIUA|nr:Mitogen-activated protein kinase kinase kinase A [Triticum urartu]